jgi:hypothetical protein
MPFVSITRLRVRSWRYLPAIFIQAFRSARQAKLAPGSLAVSILRDANLAFWTRTVWSEERAMRSFMLSSARIGTSCRAWRNGAMRPPSPTGSKMLSSRHHGPKVNHPSDAQIRFEIPEPRTTAQLRFK